MASEVFLAKEGKVSSLRTRNVVSTRTRQFIQGGDVNVRKSVFRRAAALDRQYVIRNSRGNIPEGRALNNSRRNAERIERARRNMTNALWNQGVR